MRKNDCFAMKNRDCCVLKSTCCEGCSFYKTREQLNKGRERAYERLRKSDLGTQTYIAEKYFEGCICW